MDREISGVLKDVGLTEGEVKVYLALVEIGFSSVGKIIEKSGVSASKVYLILNKLIEKGLVSETHKENVKYFQSVSPYSLVEYIEKRESDLKQTKDDIKNVIKKIESMSTGEEKEYSKIYRGYKGVRSGFFEAISTIPSNGKYRFFSFGYGEDLVIQQMFRDISEKLKERKIRIYGLANKKEKKLYGDVYKKYGYSMKYTDQLFPADTTISGRFLLILVWKRKEPILYSMNSMALVSSYFSFFQDAWKKAKA